MNSKNVLITLLTIATGLLLSLTLHFRNKSTAIENSKRLLSAQMTTMSMKEFSFDLSKAMTGKKAPDIICVTRDDDEKYLSELFNGNPILIYRYTEVGGCRPCYERQIRLIQDIFKNIPQRVAILASYDSTIDFLISIRNKTAKTSIFYIPSNAFNWQFEQSGIPYYFVLHPCMRISNIYVPDEREPELSRRYLESIKRLLQ